MKYTAGPWKAFGSTVYAGEVMIATAECEAWRDIAGYDDAPAMPDSPGELNEYGHSTHGAGVEESWENARLIAAAPELYAALREMAFYFQNDLTSPLAAEMYARVEVALARVDGAASPDPDAETERLIEAHQEDREDWSSKLYKR